MAATPPDQQAIADAVAELEPWALDTLARFVRCDSSLGHERLAQEYIADVFERAGLAVRIHPVDLDRIRDLPGFSPVDWTYDDRPNVVGVHDPGASEGRSLILNGHVDVVTPEPAALWSSPPFEPRIVKDEPDGERWMLGRGAGDMKGGTTAYLWAIGALRELGFQPASKLIFQSPIEEECTGNGTLALCAHGYTADACLIPEPFDETILARQLGVLWFEVLLSGRTTHVLGTSQGVNAIEKSWVVIQALRELEKELNAPERIPEGYRHVAHPLNLNVGVIRGGEWASTVAGECRTRLRMALFPGESCADLKKTIEQRVAEVAAQDSWLRQHPPEVQYVGFQAEGCEFDTEGELAQQLEQTHVAWRGSPPAKLAATCTTDVRFFNQYYGIPATCYGPTARDIHGADEQVSIDSMRRVAEVMSSFIGRWCGLKRRTG